VYATNQRVRCLSQENAGKCAALNYALVSTNAQVVVTLDADTLLDKDALPLLLRHFADSRVAAVAGAASVGNTVNLLTRLQEVEYVTNQNLDRRALELVNGITVVPGCIGAWRRDALLSIGGFLADTWPRMLMPLSDWSGLAGGSCASRTLLLARKHPRRYGLS
jgi:peptidoglycan-N-acetylglucosamine deacetylase